MKKNPDFIIYILAILYFLCDGTIGYAQEDESYCSTYTFEMIPGDSIRLIPEEDGNTFTGQISKKVDLNFDGLDDFIIINWPNNGNETETFDVQKEYTLRGKTYQVGRLLLKDFQYGPLTLRVIEKDTITDILAPMDEYPDLEMSRADLIQLHERPFFFVIDRYRVYLVDLENEKISARIQPGLGVEYGDDSISGTVNGFQFFDEDNYLLGIAASYGLFCFNISDLDHPKELLRYSSQSDDQGQPYFFLEQNPDGYYNGIMSQSDTTKKSTHVSNFYTAAEKATYLFQDAHLAVPEEPYADPADYEIGRPKSFVLLYEKGTNGKKILWVVDLQKRTLIKGEEAQRFIEKNP